jgi:hypothetical protein
MITIILFVLSLQTPNIPENIEFCQYVYNSGQNPLNEPCNFDIVSKTIQK